MIYPNLSLSANRPRRGPDASWMAAAACRGLDPAVFHPDSDTGKQAARQICAGCPVRAACLDWAILTAQTDGIWGGMTIAQRKRHRALTNSGGAL